ncbi:sulfatase [Portibacter marinus]|uniref:sulfatase n=1 Tax=Portibacter marinus TaxID=2898660 RepID=UPI001F29917B|nr:sulfatase [Portibacter marinus]
MNYRFSLYILFLFTTLLLGCKNQKQPIAVKVNSQAKNLLLVIVDDLNKTLGCYGHPTIKTPNVDRLAEMGIQFNHAYSNYAVCNPSRSSFLTGLYPQTTQILDNRKGIQSTLGDHKTLPALFKHNGYYTVSLGKIFHTNEAKHNDLKAWDEINDYGPTPLGEKGEKRNLTDGVLKWCWWMAAEGTDEDQGDGQTARRAVEILEAKRDKPLFLAVGLKKPHDPFIAPKKYFDMYPLEEVQLPELPKDWSPPFDHTLPPETEQFDQFTELDKKEFLRSYYACTSFMDAQLGKILDALERTNAIENTLIVFMGDHGYHLGEHNWWNKVTLFERGTSAPFIVSGPEVQSKVKSNVAMIEFVDLYPTLVDYFSLEDASSNLEGKSFVANFQKPERAHRAEVYAVINRGDMMGRTIKNEEWRYVEWDGGNQGVELYDQSNDPMEYHNQADNPEFKNVIEQMSSLLERH